MNYLLVMPRYVDKIGEWYHFPLGIPYVSSNMKKAGLNVYTLNMNNEHGAVCNVLEESIQKYKIDVVLTGGLSFQYSAIKEILLSVKQVNPNIATITGGGIITSAPETGMTVLEYSDYGIIGEGEITTVALCKALEGHEDINAIAGIIYGDIDNWQRTAPRKDIEDLDQIAFPDYEGFGFEKIMAMVASLQGINETNAITMSSSRSCPFQCTFCFHTSGSRYRQRSLDNFFAELDLLVEKYGVQYIFVSDELFAYNIERVKEFCHRMQPYGIKWWAQFRVSDITEEMVGLLKKGNCVTMGFGLESADDRILKSMRKGIEFSQTEKALELVYKAGITIQGGFIFGDVEETLETATKTLDWWREHAHYGITLNFITAYPGTPLYQYAVKSGIIEDEVQFIKDGCPVVNLSKMTTEELAWLAEQVIKLPQGEMKEPKHIGEIAIDYENKSMSLNGECIACGLENSWHAIRFFTRNVLTCKACGQKHKLPILKELTNSIASRVEILLAQYGKLAVWGINDYFADISKKIDFFQNENIYFVDNSRIKQGTKINGNIIYAPAVLAEQEIRVVIIPVVSLVTTIEKQIQNDFKRVQKIVNVLDLIQRDKGKENYAK